MATRTEIDLRVRSIITQIECGNKRSEIIKTCTEQWGVSSRTVERYMPLAVKIVIQKMDEEAAKIEEEKIRKEIEKLCINLKDFPKLQEKINNMLKVSNSIKKYHNPTDFRNN